MKSERDFYKTIVDTIYEGIYFMDLNRTITFWNNGAERITGYRAEEVINKHCKDSILVHIDERCKDLCHGLCPAVQTMEQGRGREEKLYLHHKNGYRVPVLARTVPMIDKKGAIIGAMQVFAEQTNEEAMHEKVKELEAMALLDALTEIGNRRYAEMQLRAKLDELVRYGWSFGTLFIDIDDFKGINDSFGHEIGDGVLKMVAKTLANSVRSFDVVSRWGGEEFLIIIVNVSGETLSSIANRLRLLTEKSSLSTASGPLTVTISVGATLASADDSTPGLLNRVDRLMYQSKTGGKNRVTIG